ncbi:MAG: hypothetical protein HYY15_01730 [Candidatus Omnitrophica bacterium]|nr:hypothetical protein [Candidatus Omnitrophota bacterium]
MNRIAWGIASMLAAGAVLPGAAAAQVPGEALPPADVSRPEHTRAARQNLRGDALSAEAPGRWSAGSSLGMLWSTPDDSAFTANGNVDYFLNDAVSFGPLLQLGFSDDLTLVGLSGQGKYWVNLPQTNGRGRLNFQAGVGFAHADFRGDDSSWLVPLGIGYDYAVKSGMSLTAAFLLNFTNLNTGGGTGADVMPGFAFGLRF